MKTVEILETLDARGPRWQQAMETALVAAEQIQDEKTLAFAARTNRTFAEARASEVWAEVGRAFTAAKWGSRK